MSIHADSTGERNMSSGETCIKHRAFNQDGCFSCQMCVKKWFVCVCVGVFVCVWGWLFSWTWFPNACCSGYHKNIALPPLSASQGISKLSHCLISSSSNRVILAWLSEFPHVEKNTCCFNYTWPRITELWNSMMSHSPPTDTSNYMGQIRSFKKWNGRKCFLLHIQHDAWPRILLTRA